MFAKGRKGEFEDAPIAVVEGDEDRTGRKIGLSPPVGEEIMERDRLVASRPEIPKLSLELLWRDVIASIHVALRDICHLVIGECRNDRGAPQSTSVQLLSR